jgi:hypothetical protein
MGVAHDVALLDIAILFKETRDFILSERGVDAGDEQIRARVAALVVVVPALWWRATASMLKAVPSRKEDRSSINLPAIATTGRGTAVTRSVVATVSTRRPAAIAFVAARLV